MRYRRGLSSVALIGVLGLFSCSESPVSHEGETGGVRFSLTASANSPFSRLARSAEVVISSQCSDTIRRPLTIAGNTVSGSVVGLSPCHQARFEVLVYDSAFEICYFGSTDGQIRAGMVSNMVITLRRGSGLGSAVITGIIVDTLDTLAPNCFVVDSIRMDDRMTLVRRDCFGSIVIDTIIHPSWQSQCTLVSSVPISPSIWIRILDCGGFIRHDTVSFVIDPEFVPPPDTSRQQRLPRK